MRTLFTNGKIYLDRYRFAEAVLIEDDKIKKIGSMLELVPYIIDSKVIDLQGRTVLPGFNDSHLHLYGTASFMQAVNLYGRSSIGEIITRSLDFITSHPKKQEILTGRGWNQDYFLVDSRLPNRKDLDQISLQRPIVFPRACGHIVVVNSRALEQANINRTTVCPVGGAIDVDEQGEPTGILRENALLLIEGLYPQPTVQEMFQHLKNIAHRANSMGITSVQTNDLHIGEDNWQVLDDAYRMLAEEGLLKVYHQISFSNLAEFQQRISGGFHPSEHPFNRYGCLKLFADGSLGARTAALRSPYADDPSTSGIEVLSPAQLDTWITTATDASIQVAIHAIGDRAIQNVLDAYMKSCHDNNELRHGIIHCQITDMEILRTFRKLDILAYVQPIFLHYDLHIVQQRVGKALADTSYAFKTMETLKLHTAYGTDAPVEDFNPINNIYCAITRKDLDGEPKNGFNPKESVDLATAIDAYTVGSAYASFDEHHKGRLFEGYDADLIVLDKPIFALEHDAIRSVSVVMTTVGGRIVYEK
ncbi:MAG: amidohydrolase [Erysipelotrichales bacterium]|nr:MAG: amidohydrolase [Erysipelotrichales bacterium]